MSVHSNLLTVAIGLTAAGVGFQVIGSVVELGIASGETMNPFTVLAGLGLLFLGVLLAVYGFFYLMAILHGGPATEA